MNAHHTYYIDKREDSICLNGDWQFCWTEEAVEHPGELNYPYQAPIPGTVYRCLHKAGVLPDLYFGDNSHQYAWIDSKIWYFRRMFSLPADWEQKDVYLCFDGAGYLCRVWCNGALLCSHEGMFGGPILNLQDCNEMLLQDEMNELIVEVTPPYPDYARSSAHDIRSLNQIVPWALRRDGANSHGDFSVFGIWRDVRMEIVPKYHISRPHLYTEELNDSAAHLYFQVEIADPQIRELDCVSCETTPDLGHQVAYRSSLDARPVGKQLGIRLRLEEKTSGKMVYQSEDVVDIWDKNYICQNSKYRECQFFCKEILLEKPSLWWPNNMGEKDAFLYRVTVELLDSGEVLDRLVFDTGIRTLTYRYTAGERHRTKWEKLHFIVNGCPVFLKGMNWMPVDAMLDVEEEDLRWTLELAKREGIQLLRVWSGGGMPEEDRFYAICDELGLMVMQDNFIANQTTERWDRQVLASQVCQNLYRIRNHPALALHTGGNEFNPYELNNDAAMWVIAREVEDLDPSRKFWRTTDEKGTAHIYEDMEPVWYRKLYNQLPFIGESGIHSFPNAKSLRQQISQEEYALPLDNIFSEEFRGQHPQLINHFAEFLPERIPRMLSRATAISDMREITLPELCEATQLAAYEFYQMMIQAMRENYPVCGGIMPWVFKRPWATVGVQLVDGLGEPTASYYAVKNAYEPLMTELALREVTYAPGEVICPDLRLICDDFAEYTDLTVCYELYSPSLELVHREDFICESTAGQYMRQFKVSETTLPEEWTEKYFFQRAAVYAGEIMLHQSFYWCRILERFRDTAALETFREKKAPNLYLEKGPWLKPQLSELAGDMEMEVLEQAGCERAGECRWTLLVRLINCGKTPLFPVKLEVFEDKTLMYGQDNYFFLPGGASRELTLHIRVKDPGMQTITVSAETWVGQCKCSRNICCRLS